MRAMGKREIGKLSVFDLVISVMIAEIAVIVIEDLSRPMWEGIMPMVVLLAIQVGMAIIGLKSRKFRQLTDGKPSIIMAKGKLNRDVMRKQRYNLDDLMLQLRENGMSRLADVEFAILETTGKLSVIPKESKDDQDHDMSHRHQSELGAKDNDKNGSSKAVIPPNYRFETLPVPLIMDGKVQDNNLAQLEKTRFWLKNVLQEQGVNDFKEVFLCTIDHKGRVYVDSNRKPRP
ncbi:DUF421 domain-containing protein [Paenibacillus gorillae]|uniref:DUF421 domain-containing protein n=1 Tax=Paenibacillus gorillae TaxID=1243662 RepID=UPI003B502EB2